MADHSLPLGKYSTLRLYQIYDQTIAVHVIEALLDGVLILSFDNQHPELLSDVLVITNQIGDAVALARFKSLYILNIT